MQAPGGTAMSTQDVRTVNGIQGLQGLTIIGCILYLIFMTQLNDCISGHTRVKLESPIICECRCAP